MTSHLPPTILEHGFLLPQRRLVQVQLPHHLERARPDADALAHDDALADAFDAIPLHLPRRFEEMIRRLLETGELQDAVAHLGQPEAGDAQHLALVRHHVGQQLHVPRVNVHVAHDERDLVDDGLARRLDPEDLPHFHDRIGFCGGAVDTFRVHAGAETVAFHEQSVAILVVRLDDGARRSFVAGKWDIWEETPDLLHAKEGFRVFLRRSFALPDRMNVDAEIITEVSEMFVFEFELPMLQDCFEDIVHGEVQLEFIDRCKIDLDGDVAIIARPDVVDMRDDLETVSVELSYLQIMAEGSLLRP